MNAPSEILIEQLQARIIELEQENAVLRRSTFRYRQVVENSPISILFINTAGYITEMNAACEQIFGLAIDDLNAQACPIFTNPQLVKNGALVQMLKAFSGESSIVSCADFYDTSAIGGNKSFGRGHYTPIRDETGGVQEIVEIAPDLKDLLEVQQALFQVRDQAAQERTKLLTTIAQVANLLLKASDYMTVLPTVVQLLGEAVGSNRCSIMQDVSIAPTVGKPAVKVLSEWCIDAPYSVELTPRIDQTYLWEEAPEVYAKVAQAEVANFLVAELSDPGRSLFEAQGNTAVLFVPIMTSGKLWGQINFDNCGEARLYDEAEIAILKIAADSIASAIERQAKEEKLRARSQELEQLNAQLERSLHLVQVRESLLEAAATATTALLTADNLDAAVMIALQALGESLETDRVAVVDNIEGADSLGQWRLLYEWDSPQTLRQADQPDLVQGSWEGIEDWYECLSQEQMVTKLLEELPEPFRSGQAKLGVKALHFMPIFVEGQYWGQVGFDDCREAKYRSPAELSVFKIVTACIGSAIQRERTQKAILQAEQARVAQFAKANLTLKKTLDVLAHEPHLDRALGHVLQVTSEQLGSTSSALWLYNRESDRFSLHLVYLDGEIIAALPETLDRLAGQWIWNGDLNRDLVLKQHIVDRAPVLYDMNSLRRGQRRVLERLGIKAMLGIPLVLGSEIVGSFTIRFSDPHELKPEELELTQALAHQATLATQLLKMATQTQQSAIVAERNRMARDIHDSLAQSLTGVVMQLNAATEFLTMQPQQTQACITRAQDLAKQGLSEARRSVWLLYHNDSTANSLVDALNRLIEQMATGTSTIINLDVEGVPYCLDAPISLNLLRIAQESLTNALRHANAQTIHLRLSYAADQVQLQIEDDGCGFDPSMVKQGLGLVGMRDRATGINAILKIDSQLGTGTRTIVSLPIQSK